VGDQLANGQTLEPVNSTFSLLKVNRVARKIPVDQLAAILVKIQSLLTNRRSGENKWSEWRIEVLPNTGNSLGPVLRLKALITKIDGEMTSHFSSLVPNKRAEVVYID
jgi:thymidylate synthase